MLFDKFKQINSREAKLMIDQKGVLVIDARSPQSYQESHIEGAKSVPGDQLDIYLKKADKSSAVICYCYKGLSSRWACKKFIKAGFVNVYNLKGGFSAWSNTFGESEKT